MIDILLATFNSEKYLKQQLDSLLCQSFKDFKLIISDDCSNDGTLDILTQYESRFKNFELHKNTVPGGSAKNNFFRLISYSNSKYIMFCDHDDVWNSDKIEKSYNLMQRLEKKYGENTPLLVHTDLCVVDSNLNIINKSLMDMQKLSPQNRSVNKLLCQNNVTGCTMLINRALKNIIKYNNLEKIIMHDHYIALVASVFGRIEFLNEATIKYRQHEVNEVGAKDVSSGKYIARRAKDKSGIKASLRATYVQADEFFETYKDMLGEKDSEIIKAYISLPSLSKGKRLAIMKKYDFYKNTFIRKFGQIIWG